MCTGIILRTKSGKIIFGRTLEFGFPFVWKRYSSNGIKGTMGRVQGKKDWYMTDGMNKSGLLVGTFFFPCGEKEYVKSKSSDNIKTNVLSTSVNFFLLKNCKTVEDVKKIVKKLNIELNVVDGMAMSLHWLICDKYGKNIVLEMKDGKPRVYENKLDVITNYPSFPKHVKYNEKFSKLSSLTKKGSCSQGTGAIGLPGDSSSQSRFVRARFYVKNTPVINNTSQGIEYAQGLLRDFDIPIGSVREWGTKQIEITEYTTVYSLDDYKNEYSKYGYIWGKNKWNFTKNPVK